MPLIHRKKKHKPTPKPIVPRPKPAGILIPRLKHYRLLINSILYPDPKKFPRGIQLTGTKRALLVMFMAWMDAYDYPEVQDTILKVLKWTWGDSPYRRAVGSTDRQAAIAALTLGQKPEEECREDDVAEEIKNIFKLALRESDEPAVTNGAEGRDREVCASVE